MSRDSVYARLNKIKESREPLIERAAKRFAERHPNAARRFAKAAVVVATVATIAQGCAPRQNANKDDKVKSNVENVDEQIGAYINKGDHITYEAAQEMLAQGVKEGHIKADTATYSALGIPDGWSIADAQDVYGDGVLIANTVHYEVNQDNPGKYEKLQGFTATAYNYVDESGKENGETSLIMSRSVEDKGSVTLSYPSTQKTISFTGNSVEDKYFQSTTADGATSQKVNDDFKRWNGDHADCRVVLNGYKEVALQDYEQGRPVSLISINGDNIRASFGIGHDIDGKYVFHAKGSDITRVSNSDLKPVPQSHDDGRGPSR